jgi:predicted O-methyltransferase YrrM
MLLSRNKSLRLFLGAVETANLLSLKLAFKNRASLRSFPGKVFRSYMSLVKQDKWLSQEIYEIFPGTHEVRVAFEFPRNEKPINTPLDDLVRLALITKIVQPKNVFEIGTFKGRTALNFALNSPPECKVYTLDLPPDAKQAAKQRALPADQVIINASTPGIDYKGKDVSGKITQLWGSSLEFDFSPYFGNMDIVYVDGAHDYDAVIQDTINAKKMLRPGGVLIWDDFADYGDQNGVTRAVLESIPGSEVIQVEHTHLAVHVTKSTQAMAQAA